MFYDVFCNFRHFAGDKKERHQPVVSLDCFSVGRGSDATYSAVSTLSGVRSRSLSSTMSTVIPSASAICWMVT